MNTQITDIIQDCLEVVFKKLSLKDLLNLADTSKDLRQKVQITLGHQLQSIQIEHIGNTLEPPIEFYRYAMTLRDLKMTFQVLRCFGDQIESIKIDNDENRRNQYIEIYRYLSEYCLNTLEIIEIGSPVTFAMALTASEPFLNVGCLYLHNIRVDANFDLYLRTLNKLFPNVHSLTLNIFGGFFKYFPKIPFLFEHLNELDFHASGHLKKDFFNFIHLHPKIKILSIFASRLECLVFRLAKALSALEELTITNKMCSLDYIWTLLKACHNLKEVHLHRRCFGGLKKDEIRPNVHANIGDDWNVAVNNIYVNLTKQ